MLSEVHTKRVEPMARAVKISAPLGEDRVTNQPNTDALSRNVPARMEPIFGAPCVTDEREDDNL